jgi:hypothetical protein
MFEWGIEQNGQIVIVHNLSTAKWMVSNGYATRIWDMINNLPVKGDK